MKERNVIMGQSEEMPERGMQAIVPAAANATENSAVEVTAIVAVTSNADIATPLISQNPLDQNPAAVYLASLRPTGRRTMHQSLNVIAELLSDGQNNALTFQWQNLRYQHTAAIRAKLADRYSAATTNKMLSALSRVLKEAWRLGLMEAEDYRRAVDIKRVSNHTLPKGRSLAGDELAALLEVCAADPSPMGVRDAAIIAVLYNAGLRRSEVIKLNVKDYNAAQSSLTIRGGKGGKDRVAYLADEAIAALSDWLVARQEGLDALTLAKGIPTDKVFSLFCPISKADRVQARRMTDQAVLYILQKRGKEAGLEQSFSPHDFRRTFISDLLDAGADIATVQKLAGHANVTTTARYDRRGEETKRKAAQLLKLPYNSRNQAKPKDENEVTSTTS